MVPLIINPNLPRPIREIVLRATDLRRISQAQEYIAIKCRQKLRDFHKHLNLAARRDDNASIALIQFLCRSGVRNAGRISGELRHIEAAASDEQILACLSDAIFEHGHAGMEMASNLGALQEILDSARAAELAHARARSDYLCVLELELECNRLTARRS
jgi:hypothetical protein